MDQKKQEILMQTAAVFMRYGMKSVNMDDVARELSISKKTLYKYVKDKNDLVKQCMESFCAMERYECQRCRKDSENAIDELLLITEAAGRHLKNIHPSIHYDLEKYYLDGWKVFKKHKEEFIYGEILQNLKQGMAEGLYRDNINPEIIAKLYTFKIDVVFDAVIFPPNQYSFYDIHIEMIRYHIRGIASDEGIKYLQKRLNKEMK
jgi:AcrR family transcriptional regulator